MEYFTAITTVALVKAAGLVVRTYRTSTKKKVTEKGLTAIKLYLAMSKTSGFWNRQKCDTLRAGTSFPGSISAILPKHSATTLRTPSSSLSQ